MYKNLYDIPAWNKKFDEYIVGVFYFAHMLGLLWGYLVFSFE
jgi:hypothetical protein